MWREYKGVGQYEGCLWGNGAGGGDECWGVVWILVCGFWDVGGWFVGYLWNVIGMCVGC